MKLTCPHCSHPVAANPIGRWYAKFSCPHCRGALQFDARTNALGLAASVFFVVMVTALVMGTGAQARTLAYVAGGVWVAALAGSYLLRGIVKGGK